MARMPGPAALASPGARLASARRGARSLRPPVRRLGALGAAARLVWRSSSVGAAGGGDGGEGRGGGGAGRTHNTAHMRQGEARPAPRSGRSARQSPQPRRLPPGAAGPLPAPRVPPAASGPGPQQPPSRNPGAEGSRSPAARPRGLSVAHPRSFVTFKQTLPRAAGSGAIVSGKANHPRHCRLHTPRRAASSVSASPGGMGTGPCQAFPPEGLSHPLTRWAF